MEAPLKNRLVTDEIEDRMATFKAEIYFPTFTPPKNIQDIITKTSDLNMLKNMTPMDLGESATLLASYSLYMATQENKLKSFVNWCESNIKYIVGLHVQDVQGYFTEKDLYIRAKVEKAAELEGRKQAAQVKLDSLYFLSKKIEVLSDSLRNLAFEKHRYAKGE